MSLQHAQWHLTLFQKETHPKAFAQAMAIRTAVFVHEQQVPAEAEQDRFDETAHHFLMSPEDSPETPVATARMLLISDPDTQKIWGKIGRVAVLKSRRGQGLGQVLMKEIMEKAPVWDLAGFVLHSQTHAIGFYEQLGFVAEGDEFEEDGILHYKMRRPLS